MRLADLIKLMRQHWPFSAGRSAVISDYVTLGAQHPHLLADIALRNNVFSQADAGNEYELAIAEGRRRCALEIITLAGAGYNELWDLIEKKPPPARESRHENPAEF